MLEVTVLSIVQGIAEFLPVSSSGHLVIVSHFLDTGDTGMVLDLFLHFGTLISVLIYYFASVRRILRERDAMYVLKILVSSVPAIVVYALFKRQIDGAFEDPHTVGAALMFTGAILLITKYIPSGGGKDVSLFRAFLMGVAQALAILPGVSRSGMTITAARAGKVDPARAAEFSFLMSAPLIVGGCLLKFLEMMDKPRLAFLGEVSLGEAIYGVVVSCIVGLGSLVVLEKILKGRKFWYFGPYCIIAGLLILFLI